MDVPPLTLEGTRIVAGRSHWCIDDDQPEGIRTATDFSRTIAGGDPDPVATAGPSANPDVTPTTAPESILRVADLVVEHGSCHVPVLDERKPSLYHDGGPDVTPLVEKSRVRPDSDEPTKRQSRG